MFPLTTRAFEPVSLKYDFDPIDNMFVGTLFPMPTLAVVMKPVSELVNCKVFEDVFARLTTFDQVSYKGTLVSLEPLPTN